MDLWDYIKANPKPLLTEPKMPEAKDYRTIGVSTRSQSTATASTSPSTVDHTHEETRSVQIAWNIFTFKSRKYDTQRDSIKDLKDWVNRTTAHQYNSSCIPAESLHKWYSKLEEHASMGMVKENKIVRDKYKAAMKPLTKPPRDWHSWIITWEEAMSLGEQKKFADATDSTIWFGDFIDAIKPALYYWATSYEQNKQEKAEAKTLTYRAVANDLRRETRFKTKGGSIAKGSFGPTHASDPQLSDQSAEDEDEAQQAQTRSKRNKKRRRDSTSATEGMEKCLVCELPNHQIPNCFYTFPEKAYEGFKPRRKIQKRAEENLKKTEVITMVNTVKNKKLRKSVDFVD